MLRPEQVCVDNDDRNSRQQEAIEKHIDQRLKSGFLQFPTTRGMWLKENIEAVLERYRSVGWTCSYENGVGFIFSQTKEQPMSTVKQQYVILDTRQIVGNCAMFWRPDGAGYTCDLNDAGLYDKTEGRRETDIYVPIEVARSMAVIHVRVEPLKRVGYWSKPQTKDTRPQRCAGCPRFVKRGGWLCSKCATKGW